MQLTADVGAANSGDSLFDLILPPVAIIVSSSTYPLAGLRFLLTPPRSHIDGSSPPAPGSH
jgi:hypothetical protein